MSNYFNESEDNSSFENENHLPTTSQTLTQEQEERIERNRKRALEIRKNKEETASKMYYLKLKLCAAIL